MESAVKQMRLMWVFFLVAAFAYVGLAEFMPHSVPPVKPEVYQILLALGLMELVAIVIVRKLYVGRAEDVLRTDPNSSAAVFRWRQGQLASLAVASSIVLYGLVLRFIGASRMQATPLYVVGIAAMVVFQPKAVS